METGILAAVGAGARNNDIDVEVIQKLLNRVPAPIGPPTPFLVEDGDCGPLTIAAINRFQRAALGGFSDGVISPNKNTHRRLSDLAGSASEPLARMELAEALVPFVFTLVTDAIAALDVLFKDPNAKGPIADKARLALRVHFNLFTLAGELRTDFVGRVKHRFDGIRVQFTHRPTFWRNATMKQSKIELNERVGARVPAIFGSLLGFGQTVFTPNYKQLDPRDGLGFGPQMLSYELIKGMAFVQLGERPGPDTVESDTPGFPGPDFESALTNAPSYGSFAMHIRLGVPQPFGERFRQK